MIGKPSKLPGMRDVMGLEYSKVNDAIMSISSHLSRKGYEMIDTPLLEETSLFEMKSGAELTSQLYTFINPDGLRVSLRPEFTSSVIRHFIQNNHSRGIPVRWQYHGPVFRYGHETDSRCDQFTQIGAELIGVSGIDADVEIISLAWSSLHETNLTCRIHIGHIGVLNKFLSNYDLSGAAKSFLIRNIQSLNENGSNGLLLEHAESAGILRNTYSVGAQGLNTTSDKTLTSESVLQSFGGELSNPYGRRTVDQIVDRLIRLHSGLDHPDELVRASQFLAELSMVRGHPTEAIGRAYETANSHQLKPEPLKTIEDLVKELQIHHMGTDAIVLDFGLARNFSYYSGVVFDAQVTVNDKTEAVGGGGRYNNLISALGGDQSPALGFAFTMEKVVRALAKNPDGK